MNNIQLTDDELKVLSSLFGSMGDGDAFEYHHDIKNKFNIGFYDEAFTKDIKDAREFVASINKYEFSNILDSILDKVDKVINPA